jgi:hypothetical protein
MTFFRNGDPAKLTERSMEVSNDRCRSFETNTEHSMVIPNDHFALRIGLRVF